MRHRVAGRKLSRTKEHRLALRRNLVASLFEHETISTTMEKAKEVKSFAEKLITLGKKGKLEHRRRAISLLGNRLIVAEEDGQVVRKGSVIGKLFSEIGPRYLDRPGGYTRIIKLAQRRLGDNGQLVLLQLVGEDDSRGKKANVRKTVGAAAPVAKKETVKKAVTEEADPVAEAPVEEAPQADVQEDTKTEQ
ncbi:MAG: 50S ribosomal protein L17 [Phycisphaerae bacterium]|nr:50S ribosomal protein L17 [Phycisphaerae bacterium]